MFQKDGSVRTSGWTFHRTRPDNVTDVSRPAKHALHVTRTATTAQSSSPGQDVLAAIEATVRKYRSNRAIAAAGLSVRDWQVLFRALIEAESAFNPSALSPKGAIGLGQLMPDTAQSLGVNPYDMAQNLDGAARYLLTQLAEFGTVDLALAAYNAGPHRVIEYGGVPPFAETRNYIARIKRLTGPIGGQQVASARPTSPINRTTRSAVLLR